MTAGFTCCPTYTGVQRKWSKCRVLYYPNCSTTCNFAETYIILSVDGHPLPGPSNNKIATCIGNRQRNHGLHLRGRVSANSVQIPLKPAQPTMHNNQNKLLQIAHMNAESLKNRQHFLEIKEMALQNNFDILIFSETWFNSTVTNASVEREGYKRYRLDRLGKTGAGVCAYIKITQKAEILKDLTEISVSGPHQLWLQVQSKKRHSFLVCIVYRSPDIGLNCLESDLMPKYTQALSLNMDIVLTGDVNCDLLTKNSRGDALRSFCISVNAKQLFEKLTRVTKNSRSPLDIILVFNPDSVQSSDVLDLTISDH